MRTILADLWAALLGFWSVGCFVSNLVYDSDSGGDLTVSLFCLAEKNCPVQIVTKGGVKYILSQVHMNSDGSFNGIGIQCSQWDTLGVTSPFAEKFVGRIHADSVASLKQSSKSLEITVTTPTTSVQYDNWVFAKSTGFERAGGVEGVGHLPDTSMVPVENVQKVTYEYLHIPSTVLAVTPLIILLVASMNAAFPN